MDESVGGVAGFAIGFFEFQLVYEFDGGEAPHAQVMMHDGLNADGSGYMGFTCARSADKHHVVRIFDELTAVQGFDQGRI